MLSRVYEWICSDWPDAVDDELKTFFKKKLELSVQEGCILWGNRVVVPKPVREEVLAELHEAHPGATRMKVSTHVCLVAQDK